MNKHTILKCDECGNLMDDAQQALGCRVCHDKLMEERKKAPNGEYLDKDGICNHCSNDTEHETFCPVHRIEELQSKIQKFSEIVKNCKNRGTGRMTLEQLEKVLRD